jgi:hypothetical protein
MVEINAYLNLGMLLAVVGIGVRGLIVITRMQVGVERLVEQINGIDHEVRAQGQRLSILEGKLLA